MHKYEWEESLVVTVGDNTIATPNVLLKPDSSSEEGTIGQLREFTVTLHNVSSQVKNIAKEHLFP